MTSAKKVYLRAAGLIAQNKRDARRAALERAHDIRKFEIELYWKRASYFWVLQAAVFTAFGLIWKDGDSEKWGLIPVALSCLGALTSLAGWLSAKGSKFWQKNWEFHIDMLEDEFEGRLHKTVRFGRLGARWSVSGVNDRLLMCFGALWLTLIWIASAAFVDGSWNTGFSRTNIDTNRTTLFLCLAFTFGAASLLILRVSDLRGEFAEDFSSGESAKVQRWPRIWRARSGLKILKRADVK